MEPTISIGSEQAALQEAQQAIQHLSAQHLLTCPECTFHVAKDERMSIIRCIRRTLTEDFYRSVAGFGLRHLKAGVWAAIDLHQEATRPCRITCRSGNLWGREVPLYFRNRVAVCTFLRDQQWDPTDILLEMRSPSKVWEEEAW
jgi:hypothetical protein